MSVAGVLDAGRLAAEALMTDACTVERGSGTPVLNETTGAYATTDDTVYSGKCRVQTRTAMAAERDAGDRFLIVGRVIITLPVTETGFVTNDLVTITDAGDPQLIGAKYRVRSVVDKSHATARRLECEEEAAT